MIQSLYHGSAFRFRPDTIEAGTEKLMVQSLYHGSAFRFRPDTIEAGTDNLIHLHLNSSPIRVSYENIYHYVLNKELSELPYITDQGAWDIDTLLWELNHLLHLIDSKEVARILEISSVLCQTSARDALYTTLRERGIAGFRYINSYEFPGTSVAILDPTVLELPEDGFEKLYGDSFESDFEEAIWQSEDELTVSRYCENAINNSKVGHWPIYLAEFDDLVSEIKKAYTQDDFGDPDDNEQIARTVSEYNNIIESKARIGITGITEWRRSYPKGYSSDESPFSPEPLISHSSTVASEVVA